MDAKNQNSTIEKALIEFILTACTCLSGTGLTLGDILMDSPEKVVSTVEALIAASKDDNIHRIVVHGKLINVPSIRLLPGSRCAVM